MRCHSAGVALLVIMLVFTRGQHRVQYDGYALYRVFIDSAEKIDFLESMSEDSDHIQVDFWEFPGSVQEYGEILVAPIAKAYFQQALVNNAIAYTVINENIQRAIDKEMMVDHSVKRRKRVFKDGSTFDLYRFNSWEDISAYLRKLPEQYPSLTSVRVIGKTHENRDLIVVKVGKEKAGEEKPAIWMDFTIHAREWITTGTALYMLDMILYGYKTSASVRRYLDNVDWYFLPVMNPDGYVHSFTKDRMWRKNRKPNNCTTGKRCCVGVDLNRNFGYRWGGRGGSTSRCSNQYAGEKPWTEPENVAVRDFVLNRTDSIKAFLTFHSYSQSWRFPYSFRKDHFPDDVEELRQLALNVADTVYAVHGVRYKVGRGGKRLSGVGRDWAKGEAKIKYVYCVEMASHGNGFVASTEGIVPSAEETWAALTVVAEKIIQKYVPGLNESTNGTSVMPEKPPNWLPQPNGSTDSKSWTPQPTGIGTIDNQSWTAQPIGTTESSTPQPIGIGITDSQPIGTTESSVQPVATSEMPSDSSLQPEKPDNVTQTIDEIAEQTTDVSWSATPLDGSSQPAGPAPSATAPGIEGLPLPVIPSVYAGGGSGSTCNNFNDDCEQYDQQNCSYDFVLRVICKRYCGVCNGS